MELLNVLARYLHITDQMKHSSSTKTFPHRKRWAQNVLKSEPHILSYYHLQASKLILPFLNDCIVVEADKKQIRININLSIHAPLGSADSLIISAAESVEAKAVVSL